MIYNADRAAYHAVKEELFNHLSEPEEMIHVLSALIVQLASEMSAEKALREIRAEFNNLMSPEDVIRELMDRQNR
jgi:HEPN domain-containing protein